jgi:hypothetical protein
VGESADDAVAGFSYSEEGSDKVPAGENLFISPRAGGPVPLSKTEATQTIRFFWVDGSPNGLPKPVDCVIFGGNGKLAGPWKPATASMTVYKPQLWPHGLNVVHQDVHIYNDRLLYGVAAPLDHPEYGWERPWEYQGETATASCSGKEGSDRYFWSQLLTSGSWTYKYKAEGEDKTLWSVTVPTLDTWWPSLENVLPENPEDPDKVFARARLYGDRLMDSPNGPKPKNNYAACGVSEQFRSWFMCQPAPGNDGPLTIPVPIMSFGWSWKAEETKDQDGHWKRTQADISPDFGELDSTLKYPQWNQVIRGAISDYRGSIVPWVP